MTRHLFDGVGRVSAKDLEKAHVRNWLPPTIDEAGHLVPAQPRDDASRRDSTAESSPSSSQLSQQSVAEAALQEAYQDALEKGRQEGMAHGRNQGFEQGRREGLAQGVEQGLADARQQVDAKLAQLDELMLHLTYAINQQDYTLEQALLKLVEGIARAVLARELEISSRQILQVVREALAALPPSSENVRVFVNPGDVAVLAEASAESGDSWRVIADASVTAGGCRVETAQSVVDCSVDMRFDLMLQQVLSKELAQADRDQQDAFEAAPEPLVPRRKPTTQPAPEAKHEPGLTEQMEALRAGVPLIVDEQGS